ncbi:MAG TPA: PhnD/SsuA/transferrin family substrate-binding protein [Kofleriaceae bacterium]
MVSSITIGVVPSAIPGDRTAALGELCAALSTKLSVPVRGVHPESYGALVNELEKDRVQYAWMPPALLVLTSEDIQLRPLLSAVRNNQTEYSSALFVDANSPATSLGDLRGGTVAWVERTSAAGYLYPRIQLASRGIDSTRYFSNELFLGSHAEVVRAVRDGRAHLGATYAAHPEEGEPIKRSGFIDVAPVWPARVLEWTAAIPNDVIAGHGLLDRAHHRVFATALTSISSTDDGKKLLWNAFNVDKFIETPRNSLEQLRAQVQRAREHGLLAHL